MTHHVDFETLVAYWLGELDGEQVEEHLFACAACSERLEVIVALGAGMRAVVREGRVGAMITPAFLEALKRQGLRIREYRVSPGGRVECTLREGEHGVAGRMQASLAGVKRVDALQRLEVAGEVSEARVEDLAFDPAAGEVIVFPSARALRELGRHTARVRLVAVEEAGERLIGEYTFAHSPG